MGSTGLEAMRQAGIDVELDWNASKSVSSGIGDVFIAEDIEVRNIAVELRKSSDTLDASRSGIWRHHEPRFASVVSPDIGCPAGQIVVRLPAGQALEVFESVLVAVVEHAVDDDLFGQWRRQISISGDDRRACCKPTSRAVAHDG